MDPARTARLIFFAAACGLSIGGTRESNAAELPTNLLVNASFEQGRNGWNLSKAENTEARLTLVETNAVNGRYAARIDVGAAKDWGVQLGQRVESGRTGKTYTFSVFARSVKGPAALTLRVERSAKPWDAAGGAYGLPLGDEWKEYHVTFTVKEAFKEGWTAIIGCAKPDSACLIDMCRLYEGEYVPHEKFAQEISARVGVRVYDTTSSSPTPLTSDALLKKEGWIRVPEKTSRSHEFKGDAVGMNNAVAVVIRRNGKGMELYSGGAAGMKMRAVLKAVPEIAPGGPVRVKAPEVSPELAAIEAAGSSGAATNAGWRCELALGQPFVKVESLGGDGALQVEAPCRFMVLPDFFADDIVVDAARVRGSGAELPSENFLLHLLDGGEAILMSVWKSARDDVKIALAGEGTARRIEAAEIPRGKGEPVWVACLEAPQVWHLRDIRREDADQVIDLDWRAPFPAQWRMDWSRDGDLTDSWEMLMEQASGEFMKPGWFGSPATLPASRKRWTTVLGDFKYPCWIDRDNKGHLQPLKNIAMTFEGPAIVYPINRERATPLDRQTVVDIVRDTLGVGPCEYILGVEAQSVTWGGMATCATRDKLTPIYAKGEQKQKRAEVEKALDEVTKFLTFIRSKIDAYVAFGHRMLDDIEEQKKAHPELREALDDLAKPLKKIDQAAAQRHDKIKTLDHAVGMIEEFRKTMIEYDAPDAPNKCKEFTSALVEIGGNQDHLVAECRWAVRMLRQRAAQRLMTEPRMSVVSSIVRQRTRDMLRNPAGHEAPRH